MTGVDENYYIAVVINARYMIHMYIMLSSLFMNNRGKNFVVCILHSDLKEENRDQIGEFFEKFHQKYILIEVNPELFSDAPVLDPNMSLEAYYKLLLPLQLPNNIEKVLYLDSDIVINGEIDKLYKCDLDGKAFVAVKDYSMDLDIEYKTSLMEIGDTYFNSGVLLIDMVKLRGIYDWKHIQEYIAQKGKNFRFHDQEVLNALFSKNVKIIDEKYNYLTLYRELWEPIKHSPKNSDRRIVVIHYARSGNKPWMPTYSGKFLKYYWQYRCNIYGKSDYRKFWIKRILLIPVRIYRVIKEHYVPQLRHCIYIKRHEGNK